MLGCKDGQKAVWEWAYKHIEHAAGMGNPMRVCGKPIGLDMNIEVVLCSILVTPVVHDSGIKGVLQTFGPLCPIGR